MNLKKILLVILLIAILIGGMWLLLHKGNSNEQRNNGKINVVVTNFATYDFVRQVAKDNVNLTYLLGPGVEAHGYEPTASDIIKIQNADLFIYVGGEMEKWTEKVLGSIDTSNTKTMCIADYVDKIEEKQIDGAEDHEEHEHEHEEGAFDEHIWTSPTNAIKMVESITNILIEIDNKNREQYQQNAEKYIEEIKNVQLEIQDVVDKRVRDRLVFGDKMPMQYFIEEFELKVTAAFSGCSTETDPSSSTIAYLIDKIKKEKIPVVLYIELNNGKVANIIADETGTKTVQIQSLHNVTKEDFDNGETYVTLMRRNVDVLKQALQ